MYSLRMNRKQYKWLLLFALILTPFFVGFGYYATSPNFETQSSQNEATDAVAEKPVIEEVYPNKVKPGSSLYTTLTELGVDGVTISQLVEAAKPLSDLSRLRPGVAFQLQFSEGENPSLEQIKFKFSSLDILKLSKSEAGEWKATQVDVPVETVVATYKGMVSSSLWESAIEADMDPNLTADLAEIFAWQIDFAREVRVNDRWRLSVERRMVHGKPVGWGKILAAEYVNAGETYRAVLFQENGEDIGYFAPDGSSLKRIFLKSPIKYGRISSRFSRRRFHPILKVNRPHLGVDYAAARGTPVRAVGDGEITYAARRGGGGNTVMIRHNSVYKTAYKHLSGFGKGIRRGKKVKQGQIIGYVGSTGRSTGPHLHFEFYRSGRFVDPLGQTFPSADPVPAGKMALFKSQLPQMVASLPQWPDMSLSMREPREEEKSKGL